MELLAQQFQTALLNLDRVAAQNVAGEAVRIMPAMTFVETVVVPVMDLCLRFGLRKKETSVETGIVVVETRLSEKNFRLGLMVDAVDQVLSFDQKFILPAPGMGLNIPEKFIQSVGQMEDEFIIILDIDRLLPQ